MSCHAMQLLPVPVACSTAAFPFCSSAAATFAYASALTLFKLIGIVFLPPGSIFLQRIFLINLLWQKALSCQAFPAKKKISDKKCDIFSIIFWSSQPTSGIASGILKTKHRTTAGRSPPRNALFFRSTAPLSAKCSAAPEAAAKHKDRLLNVSFSRRSSVAPAGVEPTMGESKSPALPLGDGALS